MREVSGSAVRPILEVLEDAGIDSAPLIDRLPLSLDELRAARRVDWDLFVTLLEGVDELYGDRLTIEEFGTRVLRVPSFQFLRMVGQFAVSPRQLYTLANRMVPPAMYSNVTVTAEWLPSGQLALTGELAAGYRESTTFFRFNHANVVAVPRLLDLPPATVVAETISGRRARILLELPKSHTLFARLRRGARTAFSLGEAFRRVARQQAEIEDSIEALRTSRLEHHRLLEQLALGDRMASLGRLAAGVAHEINNPLAYVHTSLEVAARGLAALDDPRAAKIAESIARAQDGAERVRGIMRDLKMLSRPDDEPQEPVDLLAVLDSTLALTANAVSPKARVIRCYGEVPKARATRGRLGQLFLNLVLNAADAIPEGNADRNEIRVTTRTDEAGRAVVEIADTGQGIPPELAERVFDPFFTTKDTGTGTGLGLAICHRIVTQLGGEISFAPTPGGGTTFKVTLPAGDGEPVRGNVRTEAPDRARVLVVDDEPVLLRAIDDLLGENHEVVTVASGTEALDLIRRGSFDVVVADLMMPGVTGMDLYEAVRTERPGFERRFVFMTGGAFTSKSAKHLASVPNPCVGKPFDGDELLRAIGEVLSKRGSAGAEELRG